MKLREIVHKVSEKLNVSKAIKKLIYGNASTKSSLTNKENDEKQYQEHVECLKNFNLIKRILQAHQVTINGV